MKFTASKIFYSLVLVSLCAFSVFAQEYLQNYVGKCVGKEGLNLIVDSRRKKLVAAGPLPAA